MSSSKSNPFSSGCISCIMCLGIIIFFLIGSTRLSDNNPSSESDGSCGCFDGWSADSGPFGSGIIPDVDPDHPFDYQFPIYSIIMYILSLF